MNEKLVPLKVEADKLIEFIKACPHPDVRKSAVVELQGVSRKVWEYAAADRSLFDDAQTLEALIKPHTENVAAATAQGTRGPRSKQPTAGEVRALISGLVWDEEKRLGNSDFWKKIMGSISKANSSGLNLGDRMFKFYTNAIERLFEAGADAPPLILVGNISEEIALALPPACLPAPYHTGVGRSVPSRASFITVYDGAGNDPAGGPFARTDKADKDDKTSEDVPRFYSSIAYMKRPTITIIGDHVVLEGPADGAGALTPAIRDQLWAEAYARVYSESA